MPSAPGLNFPMDMAMPTCDVANSMSASRAVDCLEADKAADLGEFVSSLSEFETSGIDPLDYPVLYIHDTTMMRSSH
jgi:hypothetical protein